MNLFAKNNRGESCASDEGLSDIDQQLLYAANTGNDKIVEVCLADGANPNARINGTSALMHAAQHGHLAVVDRLLAAGADDHGVTIDTICAEDGAAIGYHAQTALMGAVSGGHAETVALLLDRGADVEVTTKDGFNALWYAIWEPDDSKEKANKERIIGLLLDAGADPNKRKNHIGLGSPTPLFWASEYGYEHAVAALLDNGADVDEIVVWENVTRLTALAAACARAVGRSVHRVARARVAERLQSRL